MQETYHAAIHLENLGTRATWI